MLTGVQLSWRYVIHLKRNAKYRMQHAASLKENKLCEKHQLVSLTEVCRCAAKPLHSINATFLSSACGFSARG